MEFRNGNVPEWELVTGLGLNEVFVEFVGWRSSILGIAGLGVIRVSYAFVDEWLLREGVPVWHSK
jgi:hypothetical protein